MKDAQLTAAQAAAYAVKVQRAWHWECYGERERAAILARVRRLVAARPGSYLARHWREVYR